MSGLEDNLKHYIHHAIDQLGPSRFRARKIVYDRITRELQEQDARWQQQLSLIERVQRETESEVVYLGRRHVDSLAARAGRLLTFLPPIIGIGFTASQFEQLGKLLENFFSAVKPADLFSLVFALYLFTIGAGYKFDLATQKQIFTIDPNRGRFNFFAYGCIATAVAIAVIFVFVSDNYQYFAVGLVAWHGFGWMSWYAYAHATKLIITESEESAKFREDYFSVQRLHLIRTYLTGWWHWPRHAILSVLVALFALFAFPNPVAAFVAQTWVPSYLVPHIPILLFGVYGSLGEGWTWYQRIMRKSALRALDDLETQFRLVTRSLAHTSSEELLGYSW